MNKKPMLIEKILDERNIFNSIFCMESYVFDKGLLDTEIPVELFDDDGVVCEFIAANDLELYYALADKHNVELIEKVIELCQRKSFAGQLVNICRINIISTKARRVGIAHIIDVQDDDIGSLCLCQTENRKQRCR